MSAPRKDRPGNLRLRPAVREDSSRLAELSTQLGYPTTPEETVVRLEQMLPDANHHLLVACFDDGSAVGWIHVFAAHRLEVDSFAEIGGLVVDRELRGSGVGRHLLGAAARWAQERNYGALRIRSNAVRQGAHRFYLNHGFQHLKTQKVFQRPLSASPASLAAGKGD
jgi:GNAT superfamily N-acetyltransferase